MFNRYCGAVCSAGKLSLALPVHQEGVDECQEQFFVIHTIKGFGIVNKAEIHVFLELSCFFHPYTSWNASRRMKAQQGGTLNTRAPSRKTYRFHTQLDTWSVTPCTPREAS